MAGGFKVKLKFGSSLVSGKPDGHGQREAGASNASSGPGAKSSEKKVRQSGTGKGQSLWGPQSVVPAAVSLDVLMASCQYCLIGISWLIFRSNMCNVPCCRVWNWLQEATAEGGTWAGGTSCVELAK